MEHLPSEDRATCGFHPGNDVLGRGSRDGGIWVNCRNQSMLDYIKRVAEHAERPEGRESMGYRYRVFGPGESPFRYLSLKGIKKFLWKECSVFLATLREMNLWFNDEHVAVTGGLLDRNQDLQEGVKLFDITLEVS